jgi:hypothetical protein
MELGSVTLKINNQHTRGLAARSLPPRAREQWFEAPARACCVGAAMMSVNVLAWCVSVYQEAFETETPSA